MWHQQYVTRVTHSRTRYAQIGLALLSLVLLAGCAAPQPDSTPVDMQTRWSSGNCNLPATGVAPLAIDQFKQLTRRQFLTEPGQVPDSPAPEQQATEQMAPDASKPTLLAISRGTQPTPGYKFEFTSANIESSGVLQVNVEWHTPAKDAVLAQVLTNPCIVLELPQGAYQRVTVQDQSGLIGTFTR